jgi:hypothetical protein
MSSKDIPRTYSGLYGDGNDLLPFELSRNRNTEWMTGGWLLLATYVSVIVVGQLIMLAFIDFSTSFTVGHITHFAVTLVYLHWIKGSPNFYEQGEMNAMTTWEQLVSTPGTLGQRRALLIVPTLMCYAACHFGHYEPRLVVLNVIFWAITVLAKMPFMNGVRILGINRTTGIDDDTSCKND